MPALQIVSERSPLAALLTRAAVSVPRTSTLAEAIATMEAAGVSALLVDSAGGVVTERDIIRAVGRGVSVDDPVERVATPSPITVSAGMTVLEACAVMLNEGVRHLVVDHGGELGIVSMRDVTAVLLQSADPKVWLASLRVAIESPSEIWLG